jgi:hypothetical protein
MRFTGWSVGPPIGHKKTDAERPFLRAGCFA